jgi:hypothetical protein
MPRQTLILELDEITAGDYLQWVRDPEPPALGGALRSVRVDAAPLGDTVTAVLDWAGPPPRAHLAAPAAGLPLAAGVRLRRPGAAVRRSRRAASRSGARSRRGTRHA